MTAMLRLFLSDEYTFKVLKIVWVFGALFSCLILPPGDDDFYFLQGALGFTSVGFPSMLIADEFVPVFTYLPGAFIFYGGFLWVQDLVGIPLNIFTYRLFHFFTIVLLLFSSLRLIRLIQERQKNGDYFSHGSLFMILLAIVPFGQFAWTIRPEILGLLMLTLGLSDYLLWKEFPDRERNFWLSAFWFGLALIIHPNFSLRIAPLIAIIMLMEFSWEKFSKVFIYGLCASLPFLFTVLWFYSGYPFSLEEFRFVVSAKEAPSNILFAPVVTMLKLAFFQGNWNSFAIDFVYAMFWFPLVILVFSFPILFILKGKHLIYKDYFFRLLFIAVLIEILRIFVPEADITLAYFNITSFLFLLAVTTMIFTSNTPVIRKIKLPLFLKRVCVFVFSAIVLVHPSIHAAKFTFFPEEYPLVYVMREEVEAGLESDDLLFLVPGTLIPVFGDRLARPYKDLTANETLYRGETHSSNLDVILRSRDFLLAKLEETPVNNMVWGALKTDALVDDQPGIARISVSSLRGSKLVLHYEIDKVLYEDKKNIFFKPKNLILIEKPALS